MKRIGIFLLALLLPFAAVAQDAAADEKRYHALIEELRCLVCQNQSIAESNAPLATDLREQVRRQIAEGRSDTEIAEFLTDRYGDFVLYRPPFKAQTWLLWLGPFLVLLAAIAAVLWYVKRVRAEPAEPSPVADESEAAEPPQAPSLSTSHYVATLLGLLVFSGIWYAAAGSWQTQALIELAKTHPEAAEASARDASIERLRRALEDEPEDAETWAWLGRGELMRGKYAEAALAYAQANQFSNFGNPDWLVEEGEALAALHGRNLQGAPAERFAAALAVAPNHPRALLSAGLAALQGGDSDTAVGHWQRLLRQNPDLPPDLREMLSNKVAELGGPAVESESTAAATAGPRITLKVTVAEELKARVPKGATLLVYALEDGGPRMPLAVQRLSADALPLTVTLDDGNAMLPSRKLSDFTRWTVLARVSADGGAKAEPGDLQGEIKLSLEQAEQPHELLIDQRL